MRAPFLTLLLISTASSAQSPPEPILIPRPATMTMTEGYFPLTSAVSIVITSRDLKYEGAYLRDALAAILPEPPMLLPQRTIEGPVISLNVAADKTLPPEGYRLVIAPERIMLLGADHAGIFHGIQTLLQLLPPHGSEPALPCLTITDQPRFAWRGMHLDVCRHFFPVEFVKKYIDLLARYKMNRFHWHLTEDQGWRIEIKKYPELTGTGSWRGGSQVGPYSHREYDDIAYGGFYTQDQIREVVQYAAQRHITVVPEIEMPGHAMAALGSLPYLGCTGGPYEVQKGWGVFDDVLCAGNDSVFTFLEHVLTEVMELFPGEYIHIGGDECPKERWKTCAKCQARMKSKGIKDEHALQSYFIQRIEKFVNSKGRKIIGWDEILEGGLAPNAAVMSWRGTEGGVAAAKLNHPVVMSPGSHCYFDHYQGDPANEPLAIGGYTTVQKVYSYEPIPKELTPDQAKYILGAQGNVWTEYILTPEQVEYMAVPRMLALAEVLWTPKDRRNEADFLRRLEAEFPRLEAMNVNASKSLYSPQVKLSQAEDGIRMEFGQPLREGLEVRSRVVSASGNFAEWVRQFEKWHGSKSIAMKHPDLANTSVGWEVATFSGDTLIGQPIKRTLQFNKATARAITLSDQPDERYADGGAFTLVDGIAAQEKRVSTEWLGWKKSITITVDLGSELDVRYAGIGALNETYSWIHLPEEIEFSTSANGRTFTVQGSAKADPVVGRNQFGMDLSTRARYIRFTVKHIGNIPEGYPGAGNPAWLFLDEIDVR